MKHHPFYAEAAASLFPKSMDLGNVGVSARSALSGPSFAPKNAPLPLNKLENQPFTVDRDVAMALRWV